MKKLFQFLALTVLVTPALAAASNTIYEQPNNAANFVKVEKFRPKGPEVNLNQPYTFSEDTLKAILRSLKYSKKLIVLKESKNRDIFEMEYIDKFASYLVTAFGKVSPNQAVVWSVVQKRPYVVLRNDKLTVVRMWIIGNELHIDFIKVEAKLQGDYQAKTIGQRLIDDARGVGITIEPQQGQKFSLDTTEELIVDLTANWPQIADAIDDQDEKLREEAVAEKEAKKSRKSAKAGGTSDGPAATSVTTTATPVVAKPTVTAKDQGDAQARLTELKSLKDKGLITDKDYEKKKEEILKDL